MIKLACLLSLVNLQGCFYFINTDANRLEEVTLVMVMRKDLPGPTKAGSDRGNKPQGR